MSTPNFVTFSINVAPSLMPFSVFHSDFSIDGLGCGVSRTSFIAAIASAAIALFSLESSWRELSSFSIMLLNALASMPFD